MDIPVRDSVGRSMVLFEVSPAAIRREWRRILAPRGAGLTVVLSALTCEFAERKGISTSNRAIADAVALAVRDAGPCREDREVVVTLRHLRKASPKRQHGTERRRGAA